MTADHLGLYQALLLLVQAAVVVLLAPMVLEIRLRRFLLERLLLVGLAMQVQAALEVRLAAALAVTALNILHPLLMGQVAAVAETGQHLPV